MRISVVPLLPAAPLTAALLCVAAVGGEDDILIDEKVAEHLFVIRRNDRVILKDTGRVIEGKILSESEENIRIRTTTNAVASYDRKMVERIERASSVDDELKRLSAECSGRPDRVLRVAVEAVQRFRKVDEAIALLDAESKRSADVRLPVYMCMLYLRQGKAKEADDVADRVLKMAPGRAVGHLLKGQALSALGRAEEAERELARAQQIAPGDDRILVARAEAMMRIGKLEEARKLFADTIGRNPRLAAGHLGMGLVHLRAGELPDAEKSFAQARDLAEKDPRPHCGLAAVYILQGRYDDAFKAANDGLIADNNSGTAYALQGLAQLYKGNTDDAKMRLNEAILRDPSNARVQVALGLLAGKGDTAAEAAAMEKAARLDPGDDWILYLIGQRKFAEGRYEEALGLFRSASKLSPDSATVMGAVGATCLKLKRYGEAEAAYMAARKLEPSCADHLSGLGLAHIGRRQFDIAARELRQALEMDSANVAALLGLGYLANFEKQKRQAVEHFSRALALKGDCTYAVGALRKIYAQDRLELDYAGFEDSIPATWLTRTGFGVKVEAEKGMARFSGTQSGAANNMTKLYRLIQTDRFVSVQADIEVPATTNYAAGLYMAPSGRGAHRFGIELGKTETGRLAYQIRDLQTVMTEPSPIGEWPKDGRVRLGLEVHRAQGEGDKSQAELRIYAVGRCCAASPLVIHKLAEIEVGFFVRAPMKENVDVGVDNVAILTRQIEGGGAATEGVKP
ncbi:MAG: tetratricopeptide repeat protein [Planctomycetota bacterium]|nr:tetratricopeptide repeat protein [Planctomycetota bacterium]